MKLAYVLSGFAVLAVSCTSEEEEDFGAEEQGVLSAQHISDARNPPGTAGFFFLPPLADPFTPTGPFDGTLKTRLKIRVDNLSTCDDNTLVTTTAFTFNSLLVSTTTEQYKVVTTVNAASGWVTGNCYRITPTLDNNVLGFRDVHVTSGTAAAGFKKYLPGANQTIAFRMETDSCPNDPNKTSPGQCGCGNLETDTDGDLTADCVDGCINDPNKTAPGVCGCGTADVDADGDLVFTCQGDTCDNDPNKTAPGVCGCGTADVDADGDLVFTCQGDTCDNDPNKTAPGVCGCGTADVDADGDLVFTCQGDTCDSDPNKTAPGQCGCGTADTDGDGDGVADCVDNCPTVPNPGQEDVNPANGVGDACEAPPPPQHISDGNNPPGTANFFWQSPMSDTTTTTGTFDSGLKTRLKLRIDLLSGCNDAATVQTPGVVTFNSVTLASAQQRYQVQFNPAGIGLQTNSCYRAQVLLDNVSIGFRDTHVTNGTPAAGFKKWGPTTNQTVPWRINVTP